MNCWIIGGTSGIGAAIQHRLVMTGYEDENFVATDHNIDVRNQQILDSFVRLSGPFEFMVYSAGDTFLNWSKDIDPQAMLDIYDVNCVGLVRAIRACGSSLKKVVVIGSDAAWRPMRTSIAYNASKAALHAAVQVIARERAAEGFVINVVAPGLTDGTEMTKYILDRTKRLRPELQTWTYMTEGIPSGRAASPDEIAEVVQALLAINTPYLNGAIIPVNGAR